MAGPPTPLLTLGFFVRIIVLLAILIWHLQPLHHSCLFNYFSLLCGNSYSVCLGSHWLPVVCTLCKRAGWMVMHAGYGHKSAKNNFKKVLQTAKKGSCQHLT